VSQAAILGAGFGAGSCVHTFFSSDEEGVTSAAMKKVWAGTLLQGECNFLGGSIGRAGRVRTKEQVAAILHANCGHQSRNLSLMNERIPE